mgnify:CR=1 FL=1
MSDKQLLADLTAHRARVKTFPPLERRKAMIDAVNEVTQAYYGFHDVPKKQLLQDINLTIAAVKKRMAERKRQ